MKAVMKIFHTRDSKGNFVILREYQVKTDGVFIGAGLPAEIIYVQGEHDNLKGGCKCL